MMTKDKIKKGLGFCKADWCVMCPYCDCIGCEGILKQDALTLITNQEKEIETSKTALTQATNMYSRVIELLNTYDVNDVIALMEKLENAKDKS